MIAAILYPISLVVSKTPVVFSSGLFGTIPYCAYNGVLSTLQNASIIKASSPLTKSKFEHLCDQHEQDKMPLIVHSSFDPEILKSHRLQKALLIDPATTPAIGFTGLTPITIKPRAPTTIILSRYYESFVKPSLQPYIEDANVIQLDYGGHSDLLDGMLPWLAQQIGINSDSENIDEYKSFLKIYILKWLHDTQILLK